MPKDNKQERDYAQYRYTRKAQGTYPQVLVSDLIDELAQGKHPNYLPATGQQIQGYAPSVKVEGGTKYVHY